MQFFFLKDKTGAVCLAEGCRGQGTQQQTVKVIFEHKAAVLVQVTRIVKLYLLYLYVLHNKMYFNFNH